VEVDIEAGVTVTGTTIVLDVMMTEAWSMVAVEVERGWADGMTGTKVVSLRVLTGIMVKLGMTTTEVELTALSRSCGYCVSMRRFRMRDAN
jgi:hypothetical protein